MAQEQISAGTAAQADEADRLRDQFGRAITDLRLSITDRCNYRCVYCRDGETGHADVLTKAEILRLARILVHLGIEKIRLTGGEPLLRPDLVDLVRGLATLRSPYRPHQPIDLALTTNAHLLSNLAAPLREAGLGRLTISMDAVDAETVERITRVPGSLHRVMEGLRAAQEAGFASIKINCVLLRGFNDHEIEAFAELSRQRNVIVRFIEFMPLEEGRVWNRDIVVTHDEILDRLGRKYTLMPLKASAHGETALRYGFADGIGEIGIIAPVSRPFCGQCTRIRITSDAKLRTCLFSQIDHDLLGLLRAEQKATGTRATDSVATISAHTSENIYRFEGNDSALAAYIKETVLKKEERHHIGEAGFLKPSRSMVQIGG